MTRLDIGLTVGAAAIAYACDASHIWAAVIGSTVAAITIRLTNRN